VIFTPRVWLTTGSYDEFHLASHSPVPLPVLHNVAGPEALALAPTLALALALALAVALA